MSRFFKRPRLGTLFELLVLRFVSVSFPGFRLFLVFPRVPIVRMLHGVRKCFFPILGLLESCPEVKPLRPQLSQATERRLHFIVGSRPSAVNPPSRLRQSDLAMRFTSIGRVEKTTNDPLPEISVSTRFAGTERGGAEPGQR